MSDITYESNIIEVLAAIGEQTEAFLIEASSELKTQVSNNTKVATGDTARSWESHVDAGNNVAHVGSNFENAIWEEFGTGIHALNGDGRKTAWSYQDENGDWHTTTGKQARQPFKMAMNQVQPSITQRAKQIFGKLGG